MTTNRHILLNARPSGDIKHSDFRLVAADRPVAGEAEVLIQTLYLAVEPAMRGWMENRADYVAPLEIGDVMRGHGAGRVVESHHADFPVGAIVAGSFGWREYLLSDGENIPLQVLPEGMDIPTAIGVLGLTGLTAYFGMLDIGRPQAGDTVLVSGAAGATGSIAGQLAGIAGCRVIGLAGGAEKCAWLTDELGFDGAIDYKRGDTLAQVQALCPGGIDVYYDNVGGEILDIALNHLADGARVVLCGGISRYNLTGEIPGPKNYFNLIFRRARMEGFIVNDYAGRFGEAQSVLREHLDSGRLQYRTSIIEGFEQMPDALMRLFSGANIGKQMVCVSD